MRQNDDERRVRIATRIAAEIRSLQISGDEFSAARRLRADKVEAVAERLSHTLSSDYTLLTLAKHLDHLTGKHRDLRNTPDEIRAMERERNSPKGEPGDGALRKMTAEQRLAWANANMPPQKMLKGDHDDSSG